MRKTFDWAALPPTAKLCLDVALIHGGLVKTEHGYIGRTAAPKTAQRFGAVAVSALMREGLVTSDAFDERLVVLTDAATALFHLQHTNAEVGS
ncbi:hypothetical protein FQK02_06345 [Xanthomonas vasicola]|uniref:Uncharacterized protein n=1 Tax=Xanthomonas vasicola pv. vasculorum NCPPB 890 TaxID=1184265 RepID=A0A836NZX1_XANVA|nr:hypothetical protein [Xanthomonas vasicola]KFA26444.1 hypothetical protein KW5_0114270 [Xanthomonas vasicola pv. vasculorum NCPPB 1326]KFA31012.1 hypothetical protein KWG_0111565 [Xanthomonas vasicola pv. vasculorum NCPPB 1381]KFA33400.1 hypothetical protein KWI_0120665 [Xanthomonas vasicola pv. vasculorum NCPPB 206]MBV6747886.1 hypothetical protein [Xanthomonas vasicola pv. vasculorum NCPPB 890]MBV6894216.1 hypothetical protein [Xanthomonas vasicola pv. vasculorum]